MKKLLILAAALTLSASAAFAQGTPGVDLTFTGCPGHATAVTDVVLDCAGGSSAYNLIGTFKVPQQMPQFFAMDISMDWQQENGGKALDPFWHFEAGGCNNGGLSFSAAQTGVIAGCPVGAGTKNGTWVSPWTPTGGAAAFAGITGYGPDFAGQLGRGRMLITVTRASNNPFVLNPNINYYAFHIGIFSFGAFGCAGCDKKVAIVWNSATLFQNQPEPTVVIAGPTEKTSQYCATVNSASLTTCAATPTRNTTWGQVKSIYR